MNVPSSEAAAPGRGIKVIGIAVLLALIFVAGAAVVLWIDAGRLPEGVDALAIRAAVEKIRAERPAPRGGEHIAELGQLLETAYESLRDPQGKHYFVDSDTSDRSVLVSTAMREAQLAVLPVLRAQAIDVPLGAMPVDPRDLADAYLRIARRAFRVKMWEIAEDYIEAGLLLRATVAGRLRPTEALANARRNVSLVQLARDVALTSPHRAFGPRSRETLERWDARRGGPSDSLREQILLSASYLDDPSRLAEGATSTSIWEQRAIRREVLLDLAGLLLLRDLSEASPTDQPAASERLEAFGKLLAREKMTQRAEALAEVRERLSQLDVVAGQISALRAQIQDL